MDYPEDYKLIIKVTKKLGYLCEAIDIVKFLTKNKKISQINYFREKHYLDNHKKIIGNWKIK